jgi:DNA-binding MarR family transcriptional regulator
MTPIETYRFLQVKKMDLKEMMILERMASYNRPMMTGDVVSDATTKSAFASQATVFKYLARLKRKEFIEEVYEARDGRCTYIDITSKGKKLLREWQ